MWKISHNFLFSKARNLDGEFSPMLFCDRCGRAHRKERHTCSSCGHLMGDPPELGQYVSLTQCVQPEFVSCESLGDLDAAEQRLLHASVKLAKVPDRPIRKDEYYGPRIKVIGIKESLNKDLPRGLRAQKAEREAELKAESEIFENTARAALTERRCRRCLARLHRLNTTEFCFACEEWHLKS